MKYIKTFETINNIYFSINIEHLTANEIRLAIQKVKKMFPTYKISDEIEDFLIDTDTKYLKTNFKENKYIIVFDTYTYFRYKNSQVNGEEFKSIDGHLFLKTNSIEELKNNLELNKDSNKYNL